MEQWRTVVDDYYVSNYGRIRHGDRILKHWDNGRGYRNIDIYAHTCKVHRLVASAFIPNPNKHRCVNHKDGDKTNNHVSNLEWCNHSQNRIHALSIGLIPRGHERKDSVLTLEQVKEIRSIYRTTKTTTRKLAVEFNVSKSTIQLVTSNKTYKNAL